VFANLSCLAYRGLAEEHFVDCFANILDTDTTGGVALWISIYQERTLFRNGERSGEINSGSRFSNTAFLVCDSYDSGQWTGCTGERGGRGI